MARCDMCGKETNLISVLIEGTELNVCTVCSKHGKILRKPKPTAPITLKKKIVKKQHEEEIIERVIDGYGKLIKNARENLNLKQVDFAKKINEKASLIHHIEAESHKPGIELARKIEKFLKIKLVEEEKVEQFDLDKTSSEGITVGDLIKFKK